MPLSSWARENQAATRDSLGRGHRHLAWPHTPRIYSLFDCSFHVPCCSLRSHARTRLGVGCAPLGLLAALPQHCPDSSSQACNGLHVSHPLTFLLGSFFASLYGATLGQPNNLEQRLAQQVPTHTVAKTDSCVARPLATMWSRAAATKFWTS